MNFHDFQQKLDNFAHVQNHEEIGELCRYYCRELGFDHFVYALRIPTFFSDAKLVLINGYPDNWVEHYFEQGFTEIDPVLAYCNKHIVPIQWHELQFPSASPQARFMREAAEFGLKSGVTMPVHSPHGELGVLSLSLNSAAKEAQEVTERAIPYVQLLAVHVHEAVRRVSGLMGNHGKLELTVREQECLRWAADGKTSWEIAKLLKMSERTVNFHLNNAMVKLEVSSRQHAVAKAALQGLIHPKPF